VPTIDGPALEPLVSGLVGGWRDCRRGRLAFVQHALGGSRRQLARLFLRNLRVKMLRLAAFAIGEADPDVPVVAVPVDVTLARTPCARRRAAVRFQWTSPLDRCPLPPPPAGPASDKRRLSDTAVPRVRSPPCPRPLPAALAQRSRAPIAARRAAIGLRVSTDEQTADTSAPTWGTSHGPAASTSSSIYVGRPTPEEGDLPLDCAGAVRAGPQRAGGRAAAVRRRKHGAPHPPQLT
jgi:hypothetical protein